MMILLLTLLQEIIYCATDFAASEQNLLSISSHFDTRQSKRLPGRVVKCFTSPSSISCSQSCLRNSWCTSTNFKKGSKQSEKGICELNKYDGRLNGDNNLVDEPGVTFSLLLKVRSRFTTEF